MELVGVVILIFVFVGLSSKPGKRSSIYPRSTSSLSQKPTIERSLTQSFGPVSGAQVGSRGEVNVNSNVSPITTNDHASLHPIYEVRQGLAAAAQQLAG